jgi:outer membrane immunogenic protein
MKIEGLYVNLERDGRGSGSAFDAATPAGRGTVYLDERRRDDDFAVVRAGLNFKFGTW